MTHAAAPQHGSKQAADKNAVRPFHVQQKDKTVRALTLTSSMAAIFTAIALGTGAGHAQQLEQEKIVFERRLRGA